MAVLAGRACRLNIAFAYAACLDAAAVGGSQPTVITMYGLESYTRLDLEQAWWPFFLPLDRWELTVEKSTAAFERLHLRIEGPAVTAGVNASLVPYDRRPEFQWGRLRFFCGDYPGHRSDCFPDMVPPDPEPGPEVPGSDGRPSAASPTFSQGLGIAWLPAVLMLAASPSLRHSPLAWLSVVVGLALSSEPQATWEVKVTLVVPLGQYAVLGKWRNHFEFRHTFCAIHATADALSGALGDCAFTNESVGELCANVPQPSNCTLAGVCNYTAPPASCSIDSSLLQGETCMHTAFKEDLQIAVGLGSEAADFVEAIFSCVQNRTPTTTTTTIEVAIGRPYSTEHGPLLAPMVDNSVVAEKVDAWCSSDTLVPFGSGHSPYRGADKGAVPSGWTEEIAAAVAMEWRSQGQHEHASVASFARFSLELLRFATPPQLLAATHQAAVDEVKHAQLSFALAALFNKSSPGAGSDDGSGASKPGAFPVETVLLSPNVASMAERTFAEGCEGESAAVARLAYTASVMSADSPAARPVAELLTDEARHAALAWATVRWALTTPSRSADGETRLLQVPVHDGSTQPDAQQDGEQSLPVSLVWGGRLPEKQSQAMDRAVAWQWVKPWMEASIEDVTQPLPEISQGSTLYGDAVSKAAEMVRAELRRLEGSTAAQMLV